MLMLDVMTFADPKTGPSMIKDNLAGILREEIISGRLAPGGSIVEGKWAARLNVAQASIREALNILVSEGFVEKGSGRSARVTKLTDEDVIQIYRVREALERLAARLVAEKQPDLSDLDQAIADMRSAAECGNVRAFYERDVQFHMLICRKSGNIFLEQAVRRLIVPLFAFVVMRAHGSSADVEHWKKSIEHHQHIIEAIRSGDPVYAEHQAGSAIQIFFSGTYDVLVREKTLARADPLK